MEEKPFVPHSHSPYGEVGSGLYSTRCISSFKVAQNASSLVLSEVVSIPLEKGSVFTMVDYGTADGGISMGVIYSCVKAIREKYGDELPINVIYEDQPINDFASVFLKTQGLLPGPRSFFLDFPNVFVMASGTDFYSQCFPRNSVTLGFSSTCVHWLRDKPCDITGALFYLFATVPEEKEKFRVKAEKDWELHLMKRAVELIPGGSMVFAELTVAKDDDSSGYSNYIYHSWLSKLWKELLDDGVITKEEFTKTSFNAYLRTPDEFQKPFLCPDSPVVKAGLEMVSIETKVVPCPYREKWIKEGGDAKQHAKEFVESIRLWGNGSFLSGLSDSRSDEEKIKIVDEVYRRYEAEVAKCPVKHGVPYTHAYFIIRKRR